MADNLCFICHLPVNWFGDDDNGEWLHADRSALCIVVRRTPWSTRLLWNVWRRPVPHLFKRWTVDTWSGPVNGFCLRRSADRYRAEAMQDDAVQVS